MKLRRAMFGLRPVTREFLGNGKWPIEEQRIVNAAKEGEASMVDEMLKEFDQTKEKGLSLDELITGNGILVNWIIEIPEEEKEEVKPQVVPKVNIEDAKGGWAEPVDIEVDEPEEVKGEETGTFVAPTQGTELALSRIKNSLVSGLHCVVGEYETALRLLKKQIALINPEPLKPAMQHAYLYGKPRITTLPNIFSTEMQLVTNSKLPVAAIKVELLIAIHRVILLGTVYRQGWIIRLTVNSLKHLWNLKTAFR